MKRLLFSFALLICAAPVIAQTPTLVQWKSIGTDGPEPSSGLEPDWMTGCLQNSTKSGNEMVVFVTTIDNPVSEVTVSDDKSNTYTMEKSEFAGSQLDAIYVAPNIASGTQCVTIALATGGGGDQAILTEWQNLATSSPVDTSGASTATSGTTVPCGSITTGTSGDLLLDFTNVVSFSTNPGGSMTWTAQSGASWVLLQADGMGYTGIQYEVQSSAGSINPTMTVSSTLTRANVVCIALKAASSGSGPGTGIHVNGVAIQNTWGYAGNPSGSTATIQFPCYGNDLYLNVIEDTSDNISSITDSNSNTWAALTAAANGDYQTRWWHVSSYPATCSSTEKLTLTFASDPQENSLPSLFQLFDVSNSGGYDSSATCGSGSPPCNLTGTKSVTPPTTVVGASISPSAANGVILNAINQENDSASAVNNGEFIMDCISSSGSPACGSNLNLYSSQYYEQDGGLAILYPTSTSSEAFTWSYTDTTLNNVGTWFNSAISIKPQTSSSVIGVNKRKKLEQYE